MNASDWIGGIGFEQPRWLWLCLLVVPIVAVSLRSLAGLEPLRRYVSIAMRCLVIIVLAACLAEIVRKRTSNDLTVLFLMDRSQSVADTFGDQEAYIRQVCEKAPPDDRTGVIDFARSGFLEQLPMRGGYHLDAAKLPEMPGRDRTDLSTAIRLAMAMFPHDTAKRVVVLSDGNENLGDVLEEARRAKSDGVVIDVVPLQYQHRNEILLDKLVAPTHAERGEVVPLRIYVHSERPASGTIDIYHNDRQVALAPEAANVNLVPGDNPMMFKLPVEETGPQRFRAVFRPDDPKMDTLVQNNRADAFSFVSSRGTVLVVSSSPEDDTRLVEALRREHILVDQRDVGTGEMDLLQMLDYSCIILANVPANTFTDQQQASLASYVRDLGGGLIMTGGNEGFGAGGWIGTPVEEVMPVSFEIKHKRVIPRGALVLLMHSCEIPRGNYWGKEVAKKSVDTISSQDYIGVLAYSWSPGGENWEVPLQLASNKPNIKARIDQMSIGDMPNFDPTMDMAVKGLEATDAVQKHMIIISDGDPAPPRPSIIQAMKDQGITCSTIGIGFGSHVMEQPLKDIASATGGRYYACRNPATLPQIFVKESKVVRRPLVVDDPFEPQAALTATDLLPGGLLSAQLPPLGGLVLTSPKPDARVQVPLVRATTDGQDPVLAYWQEGLGKAVAFTSGYWPAWGTEWTPWTGFARLWAQIVRWSMRQEAPANFEAITRVEGDTARVVIEALDEQGGYLNFMEFDARVIQPDQNAATLRFTQTGPGHYEATFPLDQTGQYIVNAGVMEGGQFKGALYSGASVPFSPEFRELESNDALLMQLADITGGRVLSMDAQVDDVFAHNLPRTIARRAAWDWTLGWVLLPLFLLDVAVRRLASWIAFSVFVEVAAMAFLLGGLGWYESGLPGWIGAIVFGELIGWSLRWRAIVPAIEAMTHTVTTLGKTGERSTEALSQLKTSKDRVRDERTAPGKPTAQPKDATPKPDASKRFDADTSGAAQAGDLSSRLGGAKQASDPRPDKPRPGKTDKPADADDVTGRLLRLKRRRKQDDQPDE